MGRKPVLALCRTVRGFGVACLNVRQNDLLREEFDKILWVDSDKTVVTQDMRKTRPRTRKVELRRKLTLCSRFQDRASPLRWQLLSPVRAASGVHRYLGFYRCGFCEKVCLFQSCSFFHFIVALQNLTTEDARFVSNIHKGCDGWVRFSACGLGP